MAEEAPLVLRLRRSVQGLRNMAGWTYRALLAPRLLDEDDRRREYVLNVLLAGSIVTLALLDGLVGYYALQGRTAGHHGAVSFAAFSLFLFFFIGLYVLSRRGFVSIASYAFVAAYFFGNSYEAYHSVTSPTALVGYALLVVIAGMVVNSRFGFIVAGAAAICIISFWRIQMNGVDAVDPDDLTFGDGIALGALYLFITVVAWLSNRQIESSLVRARQSEYALMKQRDQLEIEVEERTRELREAQFAKVKELYRFAEIGQQASGWLHDLVNFFNATMLNFQIPSSAGKANVAEARERLESGGLLAKQANEYVAAIREQLVGHRADEVFSVAKEIDQVRQLLSYASRRRNVTLAVAGDTASYRGSGFNFHQVMMNLILNAIESYDEIPACIADRRTVTVGIKNLDFGIEISVTDHGAGIPENIRQKIFKPFFTTKSGDSGIGMGLAVTKKIIEEDFGGLLSVKSEIGHGSTFTFSMMPKRGQ